jgi:hypothetical protein
MVRRKAVARAEEGRSSRVVSEVACTQAGKYGVQQDCKWLCLTPVQWPTGRGPGGARYYCLRKRFETRSPSGRRGRASRAPHGACTADCPEYESKIITEDASLP